MVYASQELKFPALTGFVVDQAELLDASSREKLTQTLTAFEAKSTNQLVVVTVTSLQATSIENFALHLFNYWHLGQKDKNNGVLLLVAPNEHKVRIEVGYGLESTLTNAIASKVIEELIIPRFRANDFSDGIMRGVDAIVEVLEAGPKNVEQRLGGTQSQDAACPYPVLLSNNDMQTYIKVYSQEILNALAAGKQFSDQPRTATVKEILGPIYIFMADHGWPKDITGAVSKLMSGPEADIVICFPRSELVRRNLQENFDNKRRREATQQNQEHKQEQPAVVNATDCRTAMESGMAPVTHKIFERDALPQILSQKVQSLGQEIAKSLENEPVAAEDIADPGSSRQRLNDKFGAIMKKRLEDLGDWVTSRYPSIPACFPALRPVLDNFELRAQTAGSAVSPPTHPFSRLGATA